jgi:hypothetical protein
MLRFTVRLFNGNLQVADFAFGAGLVINSSIEKSHNYKRTNMTLNKFHAIKEQGNWATYATALLIEQKLPFSVMEQFGTYWIEAGHHIREQIGDDRLLISLLRHLLPPYEGKAIELFRGENCERWKNGAIGLAWSSRSETAKMFGSGLNAVGSGGVLLKAQFEPEAIISGPNAHSNYLGESQYTVDPFAVSTISAMEFFPAI